jgi:hypothetical protein
MEISLFSMLSNMVLCPDLILHFLSHSMDYMEAESLEELDCCYWSLEYWRLVSDV